MVYRQWTNNCLVTNLHKSLFTIKRNFEYQDQIRRTKKYICLLLYKAEPFDGIFLKAEDPICKKKRKHLWPFVQAAADLSFCHLLLNLWITAFFSSHWISRPLSQTSLHTLLKISNLYKDWWIPTKFSNSHCWPSHVYL